MNMTELKLKRSHMCAEVAGAQIGGVVTVMGWVNKKRELGSLTFVTVRDRTGIVQAVVDKAKVTPEIADLAASVRSEFVVAVKGRVIERTPENINPDITTGKVEIETDTFLVLSQADVPPFQVADVGVKEDLRLKYRFLDLRRPELQNVITTRHNITKTIRNFLNAEGFLDIETPFLTKSTPEGARDYLVPSRIHNGAFYALPQSPQLMKQLLMVSGFDRYYQITKCFRDEDLRADRQPEFTQVDMELSFVGMDDVIDINERLMKYLLENVLGVVIKTPFKRLSYKEAMARYGTDKPDTRFGMEIVDISGLDVIAKSEFPVFTNALENGGSVLGICAGNCAAFSRKQIDALVEVAKAHNAKGLIWVAILDDGFKSSVSKFFTDDGLRMIAEAFGAKKGDLLLICADNTKTAQNALGNLRLEIAARLDILDKNVFDFLWVTEFPLFEWNAEDNRYYALHHPFTSPMDEDLALLNTDPGQARSEAYDMILNGNEIGGGSIRIHNRDIQEKMFEILGIGKNEANENFGFLLDAFKYGAPPHGGLAFGLDRICMLLTGRDAIRDVIAFPKTKDAACLLTGAPSAIGGKQLDELGIYIK